nr:hypothetical protein [uncultured Glaciecola sp.]
MFKTLIKGAFATLLFLPLASYAAPINLNTWSAESYPSVSGFPAGNWTVDGAGASVYQSNNGQPTILYSDFDAQGSALSGKLKVELGAGDDDYVGFVLGFNGGDSTNASADYLLIDWKKLDQYFDFGAPSSDPGSTAKKGLALSRVTGTPSADEFWGHTTFSGGGLQELQRAATLGSTGWQYGIDYEFLFDFGPNNLKVFVNGTEELNIAGSFNDGSIGFYNFSQQNVTYSAFEKEKGTFPAPVPASFGLFILGLAVLRVTRRS